MVLFPKYPLCEPHRVIYKGYVEEGEGQYPIRKTEDWVENLGGFDSKLYYAAKHGFAYSAAFAYVDIRWVVSVSSDEDFNNNSHGYAVFPSLASVFNKIENEQNYYLRLSMP